MTTSWKVALAAVIGIWVGILALWGANLISDSNGLKPYQVYAEYYMVSKDGNFNYQVYRDDIPLINSPKELENIAPGMSDLMKGGRIVQSTCRYASDSDVESYLYRDGVEVGIDCTVITLYTYPDVVL